MDSPSEQANKALAHLVLLNLGEESEKTLPNLYEKSIPSRVHCDVPLTVNQSKIAGAGRGVFVEKDVAARELLFGIEHPSFDRGIEGEIYPKTCDNCFASRVPFEDGRAFMAVLRDDVHPLSCTGCKAVYYCSKKCQNQAWKHHHKLECEALKKVQALTINNPKQLSLNREFRAIIRLILVRKSGRISDAKWAELRVLHTGRAWRWQKPITLVTLWIAQYVDHKELDVEEITDLYCNIYNNQHDVLLPLLKPGTSCYDPLVPDTVIIGTCLDSFAAMVNHSCQENSMWFLEGQEMRFRDTRHIPASRESPVNS